ncbi:MAG: ATP-binding protein [Lachnospiraceae bacterium]|nr:ATP-binding protein [Lachnospiraceae bacterium]
MKAMNLYLLSRAVGGDRFSKLARELTGSAYEKQYSEHEAESLRALTEGIAAVLKERAGAGENWISHLDGFYFSFTIAHISKEFDLLKISGDGEAVLNIELKSENVEESRILKQLSQNRYYLSHISRSIYSFTYVMETDTVYNLNDRGHMRVCSKEELVDVLCRPAFSEYVEKDLDQYFRASDYLISPAAEPDRFLGGSYFLTNQQAEFKRRILEVFSETGSETQSPVIAVKGTAGTGKTLLLFDLAMTLSKKKRVLLLTGGTLQKGHKVIDERLRNVFIRTADCFAEGEEWDYLFLDEANRIPEAALRRIMDYVESLRIPCIMAYDPHVLTDAHGRLAEAEKRIIQYSTLLLEFTGNIRINRPMFSFLQNLFHRKEKARNIDYSCIDVLYAGSREEAEAILSYYREKGYRKITLPGEDAEIFGGLGEEEIVGNEFECILLILDSRFYYDNEKRLRCRGEASEEAPALLYEGISRTRERLCILVLEDEELFDHVLSIREL